MSSSASEARCAERALHTAPLNAGQYPGWTSDSPYTSQGSCQCDLILPMMTKQDGLSREQVFPFLEDGPISGHISMTVCFSKGTASALSHARAVSRLPIHPRSWSQCTTGTATGRHLSSWFASVRTCPSGVIKAVALGRPGDGTIDSCRWCSLASHALG